MAADFDRRYDTWGRGWLYDLAANRFPATVDLRTRVEVASARPALPPGGRVLSLGAGTGRLERIIARAPDPPAMMVAMDPAFHMVVRVRHGLSAREGRFCHPVAGLGMEQMPFAPASFHGVICFGVLSFFSDWRPLLAPVSTLLRPGGQLVFAQHNVEAAALWGQAGKKGGLLPETLPELLRSLDLRLLSARPQLPCPIAPLLKQWGAPATELANLAIQREIDRWVREAGAEPLARLLSAMERLLPLEVSTMSVVRAGRLEDGGECAPRVHPGPEVAEALARLLAVPGMATIVKHPAAARLLALYSPMLDHGCGRPGVIRELLPEGEARFEEVNKMVRGLMHPSFAFRVQSRCQEVNTRLLSRACSLVHRVVS